MQQGNSLPKLLILCSNEHCAEFIKDCLSSFCVTDTFLTLDSALTFLEQGLVEYDAFLISDVFKNSVSNLSSCQKQSTEIPYYILPYNFSQEISAACNDQIKESLREFTKFIVCDLLKGSRSADQILEQNDQFLQEVPSAIFETDHSGSILSVSKYISTKLGLDQKTMENKNLFDFVVKDARKSLKKDFYAAIDGQQTINNSFPFISVDGSIVWLEGGFKASGQNSEIVFAYFKDITREKKINEKYKQNLARLKMVMENSPNLIIELDRNFRVFDLNSSARTFFNISKITSKRDIYYPDMFDKIWKKDVLTALETNLQGNVTQLTAEMVNARGGKCYFDTVLSPVRDNAGKVIAILATSWDVSASQFKQKQTEEGLKSKERQAKEAEILRYIALSAGSGGDIRSERVIECAVNNIHSYLKPKQVLGYLLQNKNKATRVSSKGDVGVEQIDRFVNHNKVLDGVRSLKVPKIIAKIQDKDLLDFDLEFSPLSTSSTIIVPFSNADICYGVILVELEGQRIKKSVLELLRAIGQCGAVAIANAKLFESVSVCIKRKTFQLEDFCVDEDEYKLDAKTMQAMNSVIQAGVNFVRARAGFVMLLDKSKKTLKSVAGIGIAESEINNLKVPLSESLVWKCINEKRTLFCESVSKIDFHYSSTLSRLCENSFLCIPIFDDEGSVIGAISIIDPLADFSRGYTSVLEAFGAMVVEALNKNKLEKKAAELDHRFDELVNTSKSIASNGSIRSILKEICSGALDALDLEFLMISLFENDYSDLVYASHAGLMKENIKEFRLSMESSKPLARWSSELLETRETFLPDEPTSSCLDQLSPNTENLILILVPIVKGKQILGVMIAAGKNCQTSNERNINLLEEFATKAAMNIINIKLHRTLVESEGLRKRLLQSINDAVIAIDWSGGIVTSNEAAQKIFGIDFGQCHEKWYADVFGKDNLITDIVSRWIETRAESEDCEGSMEFESKQLYLSIESSNVVIDQIPCLLLTITDMTTQKQMNESLEHAAKLSTVGRIATQIAHEINNPLTFISSQIQRLSNSEVRIKGQQLKPILEHIDRISGLIRKISDLGRKSPLLKRPERIGDIFDNIMSLVQFTEPFKNVEIKCNISSGLALVNVDKNKIFQVLLNLLINAADACPDGGLIKMTAKRRFVHVDKNPQNKRVEYLLISVKDNGEGMDAETRKRIFEPFYSTKMPGKGTGLGLAVSLSIIDQHDGWIDVKSIRGKGSEFIVYLPFCREDKLTDDVEMRTSGLKNNSRILEIEEKI